MAGLSAALLLAGVLNANVFAASNKPYSLSGVPGTIAAGANPGIAIEVSNDTKTQQLGSMEITLPSGFTFSDDGTGTYGSATSPDSSSPTAGLLPGTTNVLAVQNLSLQPGHVATIDITDVVAPGCTSLAWNFSAQQANSWNSGNGANYLTLTGGTYTPSGSFKNQPVSTADGCALSFSVSPAVEPADAGAGQIITGTALTPPGAGGSPVSVQVVDTTTGKPIDVATDVTLSLNTVRLDDATSSASLSGSGPIATDSTGKATFAASVNAGGAFTFTATASNSAIAPATSTQFRIWGAAATCSASGCSLPLGASNGENLTLTSSSTQGAVGASFDIVSFDCSSAQYGGVAGIPNTQTVAWTVVNPSDATGLKTTSIFIPDSLLTQTGVDPLLAVHYMVCLSAPFQFHVAWTPDSLTNGANGLAQPDGLVSGIMGGSWYRGLLPDCQDVGGATSGNPCVSSRIHANGGLTVTVESTVADPWLR